MAFFELDPALKDSLEKRTDPVLIVLEIADDAGYLIRLPVDALDEGVIHSYEDARGGVCVLAQLSFTDRADLLHGLSGQNREFHILFSSGDCGIYLHRFTLWGNDKGFIRSCQGGTYRIRVTLEDTPSRMKRLGALKNWEEYQTLTDIVMSDKSRPDQSLFHLMAARGGVVSSEIDCTTISLPMVYACLTGNPWDELCALSSSCRALVEGGVDFKLLFSSSPYETGGIFDEISSLDRDLFYELSEEDAGVLYCNSVRLKWNRPERQETQLIWKYEEDPVLYDETMTPGYPFLPGGDRPIQDNMIPFEASYEVREGYKRRPVLWVDQIQTQDEVEAELVYEAAAGGTDGLEITNYQTESRKALITLNCSKAGMLRNLSIKGRPIVMRSGTACFLSDEQDIAREGLRIRYGGSRFFSDSLVTGTDGAERTHPEDWVKRELDEGLQKRKRYKGRSELGLFYVKAGGLYNLTEDEEQLLCRVEDLLLDYRKNRGLECRIVLIEEKKEE